MNTMKNYIEHNTSSFVSYDVEHVNKPSRQRLIYQHLTAIKFYDNTSSFVSCDVEHVSNPSC